MAIIDPNSRPARSPLWAQEFRQSVRFAVRARRDGYEPVSVSAVRKAIPYDLRCKPGDCENNPVEPQFRKCGVAGICVCGAHTLNVGEACEKCPKGCKASTKDCTRSCGPPDSAGKRFCQAVPANPCRPTGCGWFRLEGNGGWPKVNCSLFPGYCVISAGEPGSANVVTWKGTDGSTCKGQKFSQNSFECCGK